MKSIWIAGDFFSDEFNVGTWRGQGPRFDVNETIKASGGASNTLRNAQAICKKTSIRCQQAGYSTPKTLKRWVDEHANKVVLETWEVGDFPQSPWALWHKHWSTRQQWGVNEQPEFLTLVVSEYNKGFNQGNVPLGPQVDLLVVDSRYRTAPVEELTSLAKTSIWRCTGSEYDDDWAEHFDFVVHTNHDGLVTVHDRKQYEHWMIRPATILVKDPVGAGDTFTAALAAHLTDAGAAGFANIILATPFAIQAAQNVCKKPYTAVTDVKLES